MNNSEKEKGNISDMTGVPYNERIVFNPYIVVETKQRFQSRDGTDQQAANNVEIPINLVVQPGGIVIAEFAPFSQANSLVVKGRTPDNQPAIQLITSGGEIHFVDNPRTRFINEEETIARLPSKRATVAMSLSIYVGNTQEKDTMPDKWNLTITVKNPEFSVDPMKSVKSFLYPFFE